MAVYNNWKFRLEEEIFYLMINRPEKKNAFDSSVIVELSKILNEEILSNLDKIRIIIISSSLDDYFTVGLDINWLMTLNDHQAKEMTFQLQDLFNQIEKLPIPVIMSVKGITLTAGFELMLCCDFVISAENARFGQVETKWGMTPAAGATQRLIRFVGPLKAKEIIYTSKVFDAQEALEMGLISKIVPLNELDAQVDEFAKSITKNSGKAITLCKKMIHSGIYDNPQGFQMEGESFHECFKTGEPKKKMQKFIDGTKR